MAAEASGSPLHLRCVALRIVELAQGCVHLAVGVDDSVFVMAQEVVDKVGGALFAVDDPQATAAAEPGRQPRLQRVELQQVSEQWLLGRFLPVDDPGAGIRDDALGVDALQLFTVHKIDDLIVVNGRGQPVGLVDGQDLPKLKIV